MSGRYANRASRGSVLELRVDIDPRSSTSPVMDRISGDFYDAYSVGFPPWGPFSWRVYRESWIVDAPEVSWGRCEVLITGRVRYWRGSHPATDIRVRIPWTTFSPAGPAEVALTAGGATRTYTCPRQSDCFRDVELEVDVTASVNREPVLPDYDTHAHANRPADLPRRRLTVEEAYREAGLCLSIRPDRTVIDDGAPSFSSWSPAELHDAMETAFSQYMGGWPKWQLWGLMAGRFDNAGVGGIMFDAAGAYGGAGEPPERQGFAVFRNHSWFRNLVPGTPTNQDQAWAMRHFLYTWVHEAGHAFNFLHSWDKGRPDSLSWMNYDWRYDGRPGHGAGSFWSSFRFRFDEEELLHLRHGDRAAVIMGADPWSSGGHLEAPPEAMSQLEGSAPLELLVRSKGYFEFLEPVSVELRLRNVLEGVPLAVDARLRPEYGSVVIYIQRPDGKLVEYAPLLCELATPELKTLAAGVEVGRDRHSDEVFLGYGQYGFYFDEPGEYLVRAVYQGAGDLLITSNTHRVRIGAPQSKEEDRLAAEFFSYEVGMNLYLGGSPSPFLARGTEILEEVAERYSDTAVGARVAATLGHGVARSFHRVEDAKLVQTHEADPDRAVALTEPALALYRQESTGALNLAYHRLVRSRAESLVAADQRRRAQEELGALRSDLEQRGVNRPVLDDIEAYEQSL